MTSPQEDYTFEQLQYYCGAAQSALNNFIVRYPGLRVETWQPEQLVAIDLQETLNGLRSEIAAFNAYLDEDEIDGIQIGTYSHHEDKARRVRLEKRIGLAQQRFKRDLQELTNLHKIQLKGLYMELSGMSAKFTAGRLQELHRLEEWVKTQEYYLALYHIKQCQQYSAAKELDLHFIVRQNDAPETSGVYFLFVNGDIVYIGSSQNLRSRLNHHDIVRNSYCKDGGGQYKIECVYTELPIGQARGVEQKMIRLAAPELNKKGRAT